MRDGDDDNDDDDDDNDDNDDDDDDNDSATNTSTQTDYTWKMTGNKEDNGTMVQWTIRTEMQGRAGSGGSGIKTGYLQISTFELSGRTGPPPRCPSKQKTKKKKRKKCRY